MCYRCETFAFESPTFAHISKSYILTLEGSERRQQYMHQLATHRPTREVTILHNEGYSGWCWRKVDVLSPPPPPQSPPLEWKPVEYDKWNAC